MHKIWLCLAGLFLSGPLHAANIALVNPMQVTMENAERGVCSLSLSGVIEAGDSDRLREILEAHFPMAHDAVNPSVCLDSPGGSLDEGVKIAELFSSHVVATIVGEGAECLSACAVAFMGGSFAAFEYYDNYRVMHPTARVGFHAPALNISGGNYDAGAVESAFEVAINAIARIAGDLDAFHTEGRTNRFPRSLLAQMLRHKGEDYVWIDTVEKAGAWDIRLMTQAKPAFDADTLVRACSSIERWMNDAPVMAFVQDDWRLRNDFGTLRGSDPEWEVIIDGLFLTKCSITQQQNGLVNIRLARNNITLGGVFVRPYLLFSPDTPLIALQ